MQNTQNRAFLRDAESRRLSKGTTDTHKQGNTNYGGARARKRKARRVRTYTEWRPRSTRVSETHSHSRICSPPRSVHPSPPTKTRVRTRPRTHARITAAQKAWEQATSPAGRWPQMRASRTRGVQPFVPWLLCFVLLRSGDISCAVRYKMAVQSSSYSPPRFGLGHCTDWRRIV